MREVLKFIKSNKYVLIALLIVLAASAGGYHYYQQKQAAGKTAVKTAAVEYGTLKDEVSATGSLSAVDNVDISSKITGRITAVYVKENDHVTAGQLLVKLDDTSLMQTQVQKEASMDDAKLTLDRDASLTQQGAVSQQTYDTAMMNYKVAKAAYEQAVSNTNDTSIYSPIDGYIIGKPTPVGQTISSGISTPQVIMSVANLDKMQIQTMVDESDIGRIKLGQNVEFTVDSYNNDVFTGKVSLISKSATTTNNVIYYKVYVDVDNSGGKLFPTMTARTAIIINEAKDTLMVQNNCIFHDGKRTYVKKYDGATGQSSEVDVKVGLTGSDKSQITSSELRQGDKLEVRVAKATQTNSNRPGGGPPM